MEQSEIDKEIAKKAAEERKCFGDCYKCRHRNCIEGQCRIDGTFVKYPKKNCQNKDYPWGK